MRVLFWGLAAVLWAQGRYYAWEKHFFVGSQADERPFCAIMGSDGYLYLGGEAVPHKGALPDGWLASVSKEGEVRWQVRLGGLGPDRILDLVWEDSILYFCGISGSAVLSPQAMPLSRRADYWVGAIQAETGRVLWQRIWGSPEVDQAYSLTLTPYRTLIVAGATWEDTTLGLQPALHVLSARTGEVLQRRLLGRRGALYRIRMAKPGLYACIGEEAHRPLVVTVDEVLQVLWRVPLQFHPFPDRLYELLIRKDGLWLIGGVYEGEWGLSAFSQEGRMVWEKRWNLPDAVGKLLVLSEGEAGEIWAGGYIEAEAMSHPAYRGGQDAWLSCLDGRGKTLWEMSLGGPRDEKLIAILPQAERLYLVMQKQNYFQEGAPHQDAWIVVLRGYLCDSLALTIRHDVPALKEKAGRPIRFWIEHPSFVEIEKVVWDFGDGTQAEGLQVTRVFGTPGVYTIEARISLKRGCSDITVGPFSLRITRP